MRIINCVALETEGNDCLIKDEVILIEVHDTFVVQNIRRYHGWCDHGLDYRNRKEFDSYSSAKNYYDSLVKKKCNLQMTQALKTLIW